MQFLVLSSWLLVLLKNPGIRKNNPACGVELQTTENYGNALFGVHTVQRGISKEVMY